MPSDGASVPSDGASVPSDDASVTVWYARFGGLRSHSDHKMAFAAIEVELGRERVLAYQFALHEWPRELVQT